MTDSSYCGYCIGFPPLLENAYAFLFLFQRALQACTAILYNGTHIRPRTLVTPILICRGNNESALERRHPPMILGPSVPRNILDYLAYSSLSVQRLPEHQRT